MTVIARPRTAAEDEVKGLSAAESFELVTRFQAGDPQAFSDIYRKYYGVVFRFVYFRVSPRPLAEDLTQDTFVKALRYLDRLQWRDRNLGAWLVTIARNVVADHYKSSRHRCEVLGALEHVPDRPVDAAGPEELAIASLAGRDLLALLKQLTDEQQEVLTLRFLCGFSITETCAEMGRGEGAIKALQYRATRALARAAGVQATTPTPRINEMPRLSMEDL